MYRVTENQNAKMMMYIKHVHAKTCNVQTVNIMFTLVIAKTAKGQLVKSAISLLLTLAEDPKQAFTTRRNVTVSKCVHFEETGHKIM